MKRFTVGVIGGGTAGYFAALAVKKRFPDVDVTLIESSAVPIIGVGEATTTLMPPFLHAELGLDVVQLFEEVRPTFKLGIKFDWGPPGSFNYPFGASDYAEAFAFDGDLGAQSLASLLMDQGRAPVLRGPDGAILSLLHAMKFAYHLDNAPFVRFLGEAAKRAGIVVIDRTIAEAKRDEHGIEKLIASDGREASFDLYVDASGFRSLLLEGTLGSTFESYASSLFCDRAIVATMPQGEAIDPYTTAETMNAGWCWRIPTLGEDHRGYVHASAFLDEEQAEAEMRAKNPGLGEARVVHFRSGRHREFWRENVVAIGNAYGFVEPLESTALHMVIVEIAYLLAGIEEKVERGASGHDQGFASFASDAVGAHWDYLRWFLAVHYKFNGRSATPFWKAARADVDVSGLAPLLERFKGEAAAFEDDAVPAFDPAFGTSGLAILLLGQRAPMSALKPRSDEARAGWNALTAQRRGVALRALPQRDALAVLHARPDLLTSFANDARSWCQRDIERATVKSRAPVRPKGD